MNKGSLLFHMIAQNLLQGLMEQVGAGMVVGCFLPFFAVYNSAEICGGVRWQLFGIMHRLVVFFFGIHDGDLFTVKYEMPCITNLSSRFGIKRGFVEYQLIEI